ncbi:MAG: hypothetical protein NC311_12490 [Muribaculaceae bacterium]|nr:hypothetical protein [Muribaculaceae bacterium]
MNKKIYIKISILLVWGLCVCSGCSAGQERKYTIEELDNLAEIKIYSAENNEFIKTISDEEQLYQYIQCSLWHDLDVEEELLIFYYEISEEEMKFYRSLVE